MLPRRSTRCNPPITPTQLPPLPQYNPAVLQVVVTAAVTIVLTQINASGTSGAGTGVNSTQGDSHGHPRECSYKYFTKCKPKAFNGSGGIVALSQWIEKTESMFEICSCPVGSKVKFAACSFSDRALTWWNGHVKSLTLIVANAMGRETLKDLMIEE